MSTWNSQFLLPALHAVDGEHGFAELYAAWHDSGLYIGCRVKGKREHPRCDASRFWKSDNIRIMTDMRDTRNIRRATRFCQQFYMMPAGGGPQGRQAIAGDAAIHRATENAPLADEGTIPVASNVTKTGYSLTAHLPTAILHGFDPVENPRIGLLIMVEDLELGQQSLTVGDDLNWWIDPSTWPTAILTE
ncbi:MAG: hypothetical protein MI923_04210 [Phycisphaerales bacterium]|nr:hypothetical protein [Phycisphaerales bacterium]